MRLRSPGRVATLLVRVHSPTCAGCREYLTSLAHASSDFAAWDGRVLVVVPGSVPEASALRAELTLPFAVLADEAGSAPLAGRAGVIVADRYDQIFHIDDAGDGHTLLVPGELEEWLKFLAIQCPE